MALVNRSSAALRVCGDDLIPDEITALLGCDPTRAHARGDRNIGNSGREYGPYKSGMWLLEATDEFPADLDKQIAQLIGRLSSDLQMWAELSARFEIDVYCGLFMALSNEGL